MIKQGIHIVGVIGLYFVLTPLASDAQTDPPVGAEETGGIATVQPPAGAAPKTRGPVTNAPLPRYVSLKTGEGNARRGPGLSHKIDWVFTRAGMPLKLTAEYENWRRIEDREGMGGWVHYTLLSGKRSVLIDAEMAEFRDNPTPDGEVVLRAERGVIAKVIKCDANWCRLNLEGTKGWVTKAALWGVDIDETIE